MQVDPIEDLTSELANGSEVDLISLITYDFEYDGVENCSYNQDPTHIHITQDEVDALKEELMSKMLVGFRRVW